jgi:hypothetical protein
MFTANRPERHSSRSEGWPADPVDDGDPVGIAEQCAKPATAQRPSCCLW